MQTIRKRQQRGDVATLQHASQPYCRRHLRPNYRQKPSATSNAPITSPSTASLALRPGLRSASAHHRTPRRIDKIILHCSATPRVRGLYRRPNPADAPRPWIYRHRLSLVHHTRRKNPQRARRGQNRGAHHEAKTPTQSGCATAAVALRAPSGTGPTKARTHAPREQRAAIIQALQRAEKPLSLGHPSTDITN